jgi:hypothetical protein
MPGQRRRQPPNEQSPFRTFLDDMLGSGVQYVVETVKQAAPKCAFCGAATVLRCVACGRVVCNMHGFINYQAVDKITTICAQCVSESMPHVDLEDPRPPSQDGEEWPYREKAWTILGVGPFATTEEINKAYKRLAADAHPDHGGDPEQMKKLNAARAYMMGRKRRPR